MRLALQFAICLFACLAVGCSSKKETVARLEGSEPQRLSFGVPESVQKVFVGQMQSCWFEGSSALLADYQFDTKPAKFQSVNGVTTLPQLTIRDDDDEAQFVIQFFPFNSNTLISTRNISMPLDLASRMKRDIETWIFGRNDCGNRTGAAGSAADRPAPPRISASQVQQAPANGWQAH